MKRAPLLWLAATLIGCGQDMAIQGDLTDGAASADTATAARPTATFRISVEPADAGAAERPVLPAVFGPFLAADGLALELQPAVRLNGHLTGSRTTSWSSVRLPTTTVDVPADMIFQGSTPGVRWLTQADAAGLYDVDLSPDLYTLTVVPHDPLIPLWSFPIPVADPRRLDLDLDMGRPLWGRLIDGNGDPIADASVVAWSDVGLHTAAATSNADGWYEIHVPDGVWRVVADPPTGRRLPSRTAGPAEVGESGARLDASWVSPSRSTLRVRLTDAAGASLTQADVALTSVSVDDYPLGTASFTLSVSTDSQGFVETSLPTGVYVLELRPGADDRWAPLKVGDLRVVDELDLGTIAADSFTTVAWNARDLDGTILAGAVGTCTELLGTRRRWSFDADSDGHMSPELPNTALDCLVTPPQDRSELAALRLAVDRPAEPTTFALGVGDRVGGQVWVVDGSGRQAAAYAIVRALADDDTVLARGATDASGRFQLSVPPAE